MYVHARFLTVGALALRDCFCSFDDSMPLKVQGEFSGPPPHKTCPDRRQFPPELDCIAAASIFPWRVYNPCSCVLGPELGGFLFTAVFQCIVCAASEVNSAFWCWCACCVLVGAHLLWIVLKPQLMISGVVHLLFAELEVCSSESHLQQCSVRAVSLSGVHNMQELLQTAI